jgi:hypothetical protein
LPPVCEAYMHSLSKPRHDFTLKNKDMVWFRNYFPHCVIWLKKLPFQTKTRFDFLKKPWFYLAIIYRIARFDFKKQALIYIWLSNFFDTIWL